jgi:RNA polymerase sigma-70 factor (ECF subfamily)
VVQEAYLKAYRSILAGGFDGRSKVETWLYRIVANQAIDQLRRRGRTRLVGDEALEVPGAGAGSIEAHVALRELDDLFADLPPEQRVAMILKSVEGLSSAEIAAIMECSEGAVEQRLVRARAALRERMGA